MAKTNAERQKEYRKSRGVAGDNGERRINMFVSTSAALSLKRLATHHGLTQRAMLEKLIADADKIATTDMSDDAFNEYLENDEFDNSLDR